MNAAFFVSGLVAIAATVMVITRVNAVHALLYLVVSLLAVAVIFLLLGAPFAAALEAIVYAGAIMVLFVFVVMMLNLGDAAARQERRWLSGMPWIGPSILCAMLLVELLYLITSRGWTSPTGEIVDARAVGGALFGPYLLAVELASMLLLAGLVAAYRLGRRTEAREKRERDVMEEVEEAPPAQPARGVRASSGVSALQTEDVEDFEEHEQAGRVAGASGGAERRKGAR